MITKENKRIYNSNMINHVDGGTPKKPEGLIENYEVYSIQMFNDCVSIFIIGGFC